MHKTCWVQWKVQIHVLEWGDPWQCWRAELMSSNVYKYNYFQKIRNVHDQTYSNPKHFLIFIKIFFISEKSKNLLILISWFLTFQCNVKRKGGVSGKGLFSHSLFLGGFILSSIDVSSSKLFPWRIRPCFFNINDCLENFTHPQIRLRTRCDSVKAYNNILHW